MAYIPGRLATFLLTAVLVGIAAAKGETSLLKDPTLQVPAGVGSKAPKGAWCGAPAGRGRFEFRNEGADLICRVTSEGVARLQFGLAVAIDPDNPQVAAGTLVRASVWVRGNIKALGEGGQGPAVQVLAEGAAKGAGEWLAPTRKPGETGRSQDIVPTTGDIQWTKLESVFALPENSRKISMLMYLMNSDGELEWKDPSLTVAGNDDKVTTTLPPRFATQQEISAELAPKVLAEIDKRWADAKARLAVPPADALYTPNEKMTGPHPRYLFAGTSLQAMRLRYKDPAYAKYVAQLRQEVEQIIAEPLPAKPNMDAEDPLRPYAEKLAPLALVCVLDDDAKLKARARETLDKWIEATFAWGLPMRDLPLSQQIMGLAATYDWLNTDLPPATLAKIRTGIIERCRWMRDPSNVGASQWRGTQFTANHNWFNYAALAIGASVLWGETDAPVQPGEQKVWLDEAMQNFFAVDALQPRDGAAMEGYLYQDYGLRPYFDFAVMANELTSRNSSSGKDDAVRNLSQRIFSLLPGGAGFFAYGDSEPKVFMGSPQFQYVASRYKDGCAQLVAQTMEQYVRPVKHLQSSEGSWRSLFWFDPSVAATPLAELPTYHDATDLGLYTARSTWKDDATFFGLRCGPAAGTTGSQLMGDGAANGHGAPDQGNFTFYSGANAVIPGAGYSRTKLTLNHNVVLFDGRAKDADKPVDQLGGGQAWFGMGNTYAKLQKHATVTQVVHRDDAHSYLCDLGGVYLLSDERDAGGAFFPTYLRSITYLTSGAVVIVDKVHCDQPRTFHFRLLTAAKDLSLDGNTFHFTAGGTPGKIIDLSPIQFERSERKEELYVWRDGQRNVAQLTARDQTDALFVTLLAMNGAEKGVDVKADAAGVNITGPSSGPIVLLWKIAPSLAKK